jgi:tetratricopeptide (TPR) repeat protein
LGGATPGLNGRLAGIMLQTLMNNEAEALAELRDLPANPPAVLAWSRALAAINSGDYRPLENQDGLSEVECIGWFTALKNSANNDIAWSKLSESQQRSVDFVRIAGERYYSVGLGHDLLALSLPLEFKELAAIYQLSHGEKLKKGGLTAALNEMPDRCFAAGSKPGVRVIGWGLWAGFFQRQLCSAMQRNFDLMQRKWGVPDDAKSFATNCDAQFGELRLYPFVRRFNCLDVPSYHRAVDDGFKVTVATPQLVPAECWNYVCYQFSPSESYRPIPNPHRDEWHKHNPPPGTVYNVHPRLDHSTLVRQPDTDALLDQLRKRAPFDHDILYYLYNHRYQKTPTFQQAEELFGSVTPYSDWALGHVADAARDQPKVYLSLISEAAKINPSYYFRLADYFKDRSQDDEAAVDIEKGTKLDPDSVRASYYAGWLIDYYLKHGNVEAARKEADFAADVYSSVGLEAKAKFLEATGDSAGAFEWFAKIDERYEDARPLGAFCIRYRVKTGSMGFDAEVQKRIGEFFPQGFEKVTLADFHAPPTDGIVFKSDSQRLNDAGMHQGDVVVAIYGVRIHNEVQYDCESDVHADPGLDLIVWKMHDGRYEEVKASPPFHRFGVKIHTYEQE